MKKANGKAKSDLPDLADDSFQRFEDLTQKLIAIPKEEIDNAERNEAQRKKSQAVTHKT